MYNIQPSSAMTELYKVGEGSNQVTDLTLAQHALEAGQERADKAAAAKAKKEEEKAADIQAQIAGMKTGDIMPHDSNLVKEKLQAMRDYAVKNADKLMAGDIEAQMGFDAVKNDAGILIANSIDKKNNYAASTKMYSEHPENFTPESRDNLYKFAGSEYAGQEFNPSLYLQEGTNLIDDAHKNLLPLIQNAAKGGTYEVPLAGGGTHKIVYNKTLDRDIKDKKTGEITQVGLESFLRDNLLNRRVFNTASSQFNQLTDAQKQNYKNEQGEPDVAEYYIKTMTPKLRISQGEDITSSGWKPNEGEGSGETGTDAIDSTPSTYKMTTPNTAGAPVDATATSIANGRLGKNISKNLTLTTDIRDINGNSLPFAKGVYPTSGSDVKVMPVYKKGAKGVSGDLSGSIIPDGRIDNAIKAGVIEYQPIFMGKMTVPDIDEETGKQKTYINANGVEVPLTKEISITAPARLLKGGLGKSEKTFDELNRIAEEKNATIKGAPKTAAPSAAAPKAYTRAELKAMSPSYTDAVIDAGVKSGKIKLK